MISTYQLPAKDRVVSFVWQHFLLLISLYLMTLGVVLCIKSALGSSVISSLPLSLSIAGADGIVPPLSVGGYTIAMNFVLVFLQILVLRRRFEPVQLFQLLIGWVFGWLIDINMIVTSSLVCDTILSCAAAQFIGCTVMAVGIAFEVRCGSVTMPGEGLPVALSRVTGKPFPKLKIYVDTTLVVLAVISSYIFFGTWKWNIIGPGTLFAMIYVGLVVKFVVARISWFDRILHYRPDFRRYLFGLARYLRRP
ncbi:DUF6198 family protein [uncultured Muribaculum sp.]|uniref:YczE/YyaS/YitT family protein n=1 Tax=uncultured Muribaculum sp. TaxID=1918613 RepID=UPI0025912D51|nr:DUF6198 family protein [uncultured Muribaculum sp.]